MAISLSLYLLYSTPNAEVSMASGLEDSGWKLENASENELFGDHRECWQIETIDKGSRVGELGMYVAEMMVKLINLLQIM